MTLTLLRRAAPLATAAIALAFPVLAQSPTVDAVRQRGVVNCGIAGSTPGMSAPDTQGVMRGIDADSCRAIAAAMFGDATKVRFVVTTTQNRFTALQAGEVDVLIRSTTWTLGREANLGGLFASVNFYDGTAFLVRKDLGVASAKDLGGATVCVAPGSTTELAVADFFRLHDMQFTPILIQDIEEIRKAFLSGRCDAYSSDASALASFRYSQGPNAESFLLLPEIISKEPLGAMVRKGDDKWFDIVRWSYFAQLTAEELGVTSENIDEFADSTNPSIRRLLGLEGELGKALGLDAKWAYNVVKQVGNFGQMWDRTVGAIGVQRGINNLWTKGGIQYAPPLR